MACRRFGRVWPAAASLFLLLLLQATPGLGHLCYTCKVSGGSSDKSCVEKPSTMETTDCVNSKYCQIIRIDYLAGDLYSFERKCTSMNGDRPQYTNATIKDSNFMTHYTACDWDKCNAGDGVWSMGGVLSVKDGVPGKGFGGASALHSAPLPAVAAALAAALAAARLP